MTIIPVRSLRLSVGWDWNTLGVSGIFQLMDFNISVLDPVSRQIRCTVAKEAFWQNIQQVSAENGYALKVDSYQSLSIDSGILELAIEKTVKEALEEICSQNNIKIVARRKFVVDPLKESADFSFAADLAIYPAPVIKNYQEISASSISLPEISDKQIEDALVLLQQGRPFSLKQSFSLPLEEGDRADIMFRILPGSWQQLIFTFGKNIFPEQVEREISGRKVDERFKVRVAADSAVYEIKIASVFKNQHKEIDDSLALSLNINGVSSLSDLKVAVRKVLEAERAILEFSSLQSALLDQLLESNSFEVPFELVESEIRTILLENRQLEPEEAPDLTVFDDNYRKRLQKEALRRVRASILLERIAVQEGLASDSNKYEEFNQNRYKALDFLMDKLILEKQHSIC